MRTRADSRRNTQPTCPTTIIVGLTSSEDGCECPFHAGCGMFLKVGTSLEFKRAHYVDKEAVSVYARFVASKRTPCRVGWVIDDALEEENNWEQLNGTVVSFLHESMESDVRRKNYAKLGAAEVSLSAKLDCREE